MVVIQQKARLHRRLWKRKMVVLVGDDLAEFGFGEFGASMGKSGQGEVGVWIVVYRSWICGKMFQRNL